MVLATALIYFVEDAKAEDRFDSWGFKKLDNPDLVEAKGLLLSTTLQTMFLQVS